MFMFMYLYDMYINALSKYIYFHFFLMDVYIYIHKKNENIYYLLLDYNDNRNNLKKCIKH
jgi:hypothetical protein